MEQGRRRILVSVAGSSVPPEEVQDRLVARMCELFRAHLPLLPGALDLVDEVRAAGVPTALVSSSYRVLVDAALASLGAQRFDVTVAGDEVVRAKPPCWAPTRPSASSSRTASPAARRVARPGAVWSASRTSCRCRRGSRTSSSPR